MGEGYPDDHGSGDTAVMEEEDGEGGGERRSRDKRRRKVNEKMLISKPSARLVDLTYYFSETCGGRETQGRVNSKVILLGLPEKRKT